MSKIINSTTTATFFIAMLITLSACYPMPKEGECSTIPTTNNPDVIGSHNCGILPNGGF